MAYAAITKPSLHFNLKLYTGDGNTTRAITGMGFQPDWVWIKKRSGAASHITSDVVRGVTKTLYPENQTGELTNDQYGWVSAFGTDGFTTTNTNANAINGNSETYVTWNWKAGNSSGSANNDGSITSTVSVNTTAGFSIVSWTGTTNATVGHGLGVKPAMVITKSRTDTTNWATWHQGLLGGTEQSRYVNLNTTAADDTYTNYWGTGGFTSSVFGVSNNAFHNNSNSMIAYCFAEKKGYSKFGRYKGNGSTNGPFIYTGFKPAWIMTKKISGTADWMIRDKLRLGYNDGWGDLYANTTGAEGTNDANTKSDILSNGFKLRMSHSNHNQDGGDYIYMAFAENPFVANVGTNGIPATAR